MIDRPVSQEGTSKVGSNSVVGNDNNNEQVQVFETTQADVDRLAPKYTILEADASFGGNNWRSGFKRFLIGRPLETAQASNERLNKIQALAVFASDALSSVAYSTEATLFLLVTAVASAHPIDYILPIGIVISIIIVLVVNSYRQTVHAYPGGGGSYIVSKDNLGTNAGLVAAAAILIDYTLTVAVSVSAGIAAVTSAFPSLNQFQVPLGVAMIVLLAVANLRGLRESGTLFAIPTYIFIFSLLGLIAYGIFRVVTGDFTPLPSDRPATLSIPAFNTKSLSIFLLLQAFAAGCSAMTGVEAISDGVQAFRKPESKNAATTLVMMGALLVTFVLGTSFLAIQFNTLPEDPNSPQYETVISEIGHLLLGNNSPLYYIIQAATALILILAANTAFADFPRLSFFLARDKFLPGVFSLRGDRLAFTTGIVVLTVLSSALLVLFNGHTDALIPLYAVGVFTAFTLSQTGMIFHWQKEKRKGARGVVKSQIFNAIGAIATAIVLTIIVITKFLEGAWLVIILIPLIFMGFKAINRHYRRVVQYRSLSETHLTAPVKLAAIAEELKLSRARKNTVLVPIAGIDRISLASLEFAQSLGESVRAIFISDEPETIEAIKQQWQQLDLNIQLVILENRFRSIIPPLLNYIEKVDELDPDDILVIVLPQLTERHWWDNLLHNQTAFRIRSALMVRPGTVIVNVPYQLDRLKKL